MSKFIMAMLAGFAVLLFASTLVVALFTYPYIFGVFFLLVIAYLMGTLVLDVWETFNE